MYAGCFSIPFFLAKASTGCTRVNKAYIAVAKAKIM